MPEEPERDTIPAVVYVHVLDRPDAADEELQRRLEACRRYAELHDFAVVVEIAHPRPRWPEYIDEVRDAVRQHGAQVLIVAPALWQGMSREVLGLLLDMARRIALHAPEHGLLSEEDLLELWRAAGRPDRTSLLERERLDAVRRPRATDGVPVSAVPPMSGRSRRDQDDDDVDVARRIASLVTQNSMMSHNLMRIGGGYGGFGGDVPLRGRTGPLPHDGLFLRRNNAFGTRSVVGIADLIEQGVLIEQSQIRFDDFVAGNTDQIPLPAAGEGIAVSHGTTAAAGGCRAHEETTHFLEIALRAAELPGQAQRHPAPLPVNFVFVVDTSGSMAGTKLDTVKTAIQQLYGQLRDTDVLGIVTFDTEVRTALRAAPKAQLSKDKLASVVAGLQAFGGTDLNLGLMYGIDEISRYQAGPAGQVNCVYLFSDGEPTSGETNWINIRRNVAGKIRGDVTLSCFGFGSDARTRELDALAGLTGGHSTFVTDPDEVRLNLLEDLSRRDHLAAMNVQLKIEIDERIKIWHLYGHDEVTDPAVRAAVEEQVRAVRRDAEQAYGVESAPDLIAEEAGIRIFAPDLAFGETYWIVFELEVPAGVDVPTFGSATVQYVDTGQRANRRHELNLTLTGPIPAETVLVHAVGLGTSEVTFFALDDLYQNDRETAKARLSKHLQVLDAAFTATPAPQFRNDQVTFRKLISLTTGLGLTRSWSDAPHNPPLQYATYALNAFGQIRGGFVTTRAGTF